MQIAYSPTNAGSDSVAHLCAPGNTFEARSTFPDAHTAEEYAESHAKAMHVLNNLEIVRFDYVIAKGALSYLSSSFFPPRVLEVPASYVRFNAHMPNTHPLFSCPSSTTSIIKHHETILTAFSLCRHTRRTSSPSATQQQARMSARHTTTFGLQDVEHSGLHAETLCSTTSTLQLEKNRGSGSG